MKGRNYGGGGGRGVPLHRLGTADIVSPLAYRLFCSRTREDQPANALVIRLLYTLCVSPKLFIRCVASSHIILCFLSLNIYTRNLHRRILACRSGCLSKFQLFRPFTLLCSERTYFESICLIFLYQVALVASFVTIIQNI